MKLIYNKHTGQIIRAISNEQSIESLYYHWSEEFKDSLASMEIKNVPEPLSNYYVKDEEIIKYTEQEIEEKRLYGKILSEEERLLEKLKPSHEEIRKAENTIEILTLIQEVI